MEKNLKPVNILLIEDSEGDIELTKEALREGKFLNNLSVVRDGEQAIAFINREGNYVNAPQADLILLDINLPKIDGKEVLQYLKSHPDHKRIPVIILTTSSSENDILDAYNNYANCYIVKPISLESFLGVVRTIEYYWITIVRLPE